VKAVSRDSFHAYFIEVRLRRSKNDYID